METTINSKKQTVVSSATKSQPTSTFWSRLEFSRFAVISILVILLGCLGGMAAAFGAHNEILGLAMIAFPTILALAFILAVAPMRVIIYVSAIAFLFDLGVLIF